MGRVQLGLIAAGTSLIASVGAIDAAMAWNCHADPLRNLEPGTIHTINVKVRKGAFCQYTFFSRRGTMHGVRILQKPPSAHMIANGYALAYTFNQTGNYTARIQMNFAKGPVTIVMAVQVLSHSF